MGHGITKRDTMFSVKERPWHDLGVIVNEAPTIEEGIKLAKLDWEVKTDPLFTPDGIKVPAQVIYRMVENQKIIYGVVGVDYTPLQNLEAFEWFNPFLESGMVELETAGSLFNGKKIWILARIKEENLVVKEGDEIERFILLSNSHDGTMATRVGYTPVRVVCNNTLSMAIGNTSSQLIRVKHTQNIVNNLAAIQETMDIVNQQFITTVEGYRELAKKEIVSADLQKYVRKVFSTKKLEEMFEPTTEEKAKAEKERKRLEKQIEEIFNAGRGSSLSRGTLWGAYNAVQEYLQYERGTDNTTQESRYNNLWFGNSSVINRRALEIALKF